MSRHELQLSNYTVIQNPAPSEIAKQLRALVPRGNEWLTLSRSPEDFLTATGSAEEGFEVDYEFATRDNHQRVAGPRLPVAEVERIFFAYLNNDEKFYQGLNWERVALSDVDMLKAPRIYRSDRSGVLNDPEKKLFGG